MSRMLRLTTGLLAAGLLWACAPASRVILLPEPNGKPTAVEVKTGTTSQVLSVPYQTASINKSGDLALGTTDPQVVQERYGSLLAQKPAADEQFLLYFEPGGSQLTAASLAVLPTIVARALVRKGGEIIAYLVDAVGRGERAPLVATDDEVAEAQNRRAEIIVR